MANQLNDCKRDFYIGMLSGAPNLISNGGPFTDTAGWSEARNASTLSAVSNALRITADGGSTFGTSTPLTGLTPGTTYEVQAQVSIGTASSAIIRLRANNTPDLNGGVEFAFTAGSDGMASITFTPSASTWYVGLIMTGASGGQYVELLNIGAQEQGATGGEPPSTGHINDLEVLWLQSQGATSRQIMDAWDQYFDLQGIAAGMHNDRKFAWLGAMGFTGSLNDRELAFYCGVTPPPVQSDWILANGTWNDGGVWIDSETWNDSAP